MKANEAERSILFRWEGAGGDVDLNFMQMRSGVCRAVTNDIDSNDFSVGRRQVERKTFKNGRT